MRIDAGITKAFGLLAQQAAERLARAAVTLVTNHQERLNVSNPRPHTTPAPKGQFPRKRTGFLQGSVIYEPTALPEMAATGYVDIGLAASAFYGEALAGRGWKGILDTAEETKAETAAILNGTSGGYTLSKAEAVAKAAGHG